MRHAISNRLFRAWHERFESMKIVTQFDKLIVNVALLCDKRLILTYIAICE